MINIIDTKKDLVKFNCLHIKRYQNPKKLYVKLCKTNFIVQLTEIHD